MLKSTKSTKNCNILLQISNFSGSYSYHELGAEHVLACICLAMDMSAIEIISILLPSAVHICTLPMHHLRNQVKIRAGPGQNRCMDV